MKETEKIKFNTQQSILQENKRDKNSKLLEKAFERIYRNAIISERIAIAALVLAIIAFIVKKTN